MTLLIKQECQTLNAEREQFEAKVKQRVREKPKPTKFTGKPDQDISEKYARSEQIVTVRDQGLFKRDNITQVCEQVACLGNSDDFFDMK